MTNNRLMTVILIREVSSYTKSMEEQDGPKSNQRTVASNIYLKSLNFGPKHRGDPLSHSGSTPLMQQTFLSLKRTKTSLLLFVITFHRFKMRKI